MRPAVERAVISGPGFVESAAADVAAAHQADLATQGPHGVSYLRYKVDEAAGKTFCLVEAPTRGGRHRAPRRPRPVADEIYTATEHA